MDTKMHRILTLAFFLAFSTQPKAQVASVDSLLKALYAKSDSVRFKLNTGKVPEQERLRVFEEWNQARALINAAEYAIYSERPQQRLLRKSKFWIEDGLNQRDSLVNQLIYLIAEDSMADFQEKNVAVKLLAKSGDEKAYAFLLGNLWRLSTTDDYGSTDFWFAEEHRDSNWAIFPQIIRTLTTQKLEYDEGFVTVALLLDKIERDTDLLNSILNVYAAKY